MLSSPPVAAPPGLVRCIRGLFAGEPAEPLEIAEGPPPVATGGDPLARAVQDFLRADGDEGRAAEAKRVHAEAGIAADDPARVDGLADAVERLVQASPEPDPGLELARELVTPEVSGRLVARLAAAARDEARRQELVQVLGTLGPPVVREITEALAEAQDRSERRVLMDALAAAATGTPDVITELLHDRRWFVVRNGVTVLGEVGGAAAVEHLTRALAHEHERVRREAVMALARIGGSDAGQLILGMLDDADDGVRGAAAMALGVLGYERGLRPLLARLDDEPSTDVQEEILRALGQLGDPGAVPALEKRAHPSFFSRTPASVRVAAYRALAAIGTPHARQLLQEGKDDKEPEVRNAVRAALRERG